MQDPSNSASNEKSTEIIQVLLEENPSDPLEPFESLQNEEYDRIINEKHKLLEEYETLEKDLQIKRQQLELDLNISINRSKGLNTPDKKQDLNSLHHMKSTSNLFDNDNTSNEDPLKVSRNFTSQDKENLQNNEFLSYYMRISSETKLKEKDKDVKDYTFKPKINKSSTKKKLDQIPENKDHQPSLQSRLDELYSQGQKKKQKQDDLLKQLANEIKDSTNQNKLGLNSKKIIMKNMEKSLNKLLFEIEDPDNKGFLTFQDVGKLMSRLAIFKGEHYKRTSILEKPIHNPLEIEKYGFENLEKESRFHEDFWKILIIPQFLAADEEPKELIQKNTIDLVSCHLLLDMILALLETSKEKSIVAGLIRERLLQSFKKREVPFKEPKEIEQVHDIKTLYEDSNICMSIEKFIGKFRKLFVDKTKVMNIYGSKANTVRLEKDQEILDKVFDFKPKINDKSKNQDSNDNYISKLVSSNSMKDLKEPNLTKSESSKNRYDLLYNYSKYESKKKEEDTKARLKEDNRDCTFAPKINKKTGSSNKKKLEEKNPESMIQGSIDTPEIFDNDEKKTYERLYDLYKKKFEKEQINSKIIQDREEEKLIACTFKPQLNINKNLEKSLYASNTNPVKGAEKVIERVAKAREERQEKINTFENMGKPKGEALQPTVFQPFSFEKRYDKEKDSGSKEEPLLYLDINYGPGKIARIPVRKSDDPHVLCKTFSKIYSLNEKMQSTLLETIQNIFSTQVWEEKK